MRILEELWFGNIKPNENKLSQDSGQYELIKLIVRHEEALTPLMPQEAKEVFEKLRENQSELASLNEREAFISGVKLGARIMNAKSGTKIGS